jgi:hypothetical protein
MRNPHPKECGFVFNQPKPQKKSDSIPLFSLTGRYFLTRIMLAGLVLLAWIFFPDKLFSHCQ